MLRGDQGMASVTESRAKLTDPRVEEALERVVAEGEVGIQVAAFLNGERMVDTWAGVTATGGETEVDGETLFTIFSVSKAVAACALHLQVERGLLDYDAPVGRYWPEYAQNGKEDITVREVLLHRAGMPHMPEDVTPERLCDWDWMVARLAEMTPLVTPGTRNTYHSYTFGWLVGEIVRRSDPAYRPFGEFVQEELCAPLGIDSLYLGIPPEEEHRVATLVYPNRPTPPPANDRRWLAAPLAVNFVPEIYNRSDIRRACLPASGGIANARSVATLFGMIAGQGELNGTRLLSRKRVLSFLDPRPDHESIDFIFSGVMLVGMGGMHVDPRGVVRNRAGERIVCQVGAGSSLGWANLDSGLSFAFCHNRMIVNPVMAATQNSKVLEPPFAELGDALRDLAAERS
jgi:CubicO group peptidase (beta-lactamase class C family)